MGNWLKRLVDRQERELEASAARRLSALADLEANRVLQANIKAGRECIQAIVDRRANSGKRD